MNRDRQRHLRPKITGTRERSRASAFGSCAVRSVVADDHGAVSRGVRIIASIWPRLRLLIEAPARVCVEDLADPMSCARMRLVSAPELSTHFSTVTDNRIGAVASCSYPTVFALNANRGVHGWALNLGRIHSAWLTRICLCWPFCGDIAKLMNCVAFYAWLTSMRIGVLRFG